MYTVLLVVHTLLALAIIGLVLLQRSESDGFGISGGGGGMFSSQAKANFLTRMTAIMATAFFVSSLALTMIINHRNSDSLLDAIPASATAPVVEQMTGDVVPVEEDAPAEDAAVPLAE